jgi:hypothetical protein
LSGQSVQAPIEQDEASQIRELRYLLRQWKFRAWDDVDRLTNLRLALREMRRAAIKPGGLTVAEMDRILVKLGEPLEGVQ